MSQGLVLHDRRDRLKARELIVQAALLGYHQGAGKMVYTESSPARWDGIDRRRRAIKGQVPSSADCSAFVAWCTWTGTRAWNMGDFVNGENWQSGFTGSMVSHGHRVTNEQYLLADVALYGDPWGPTGHTALLVGKQGGVPVVVSFGSPGGPRLLPLHYRSDLAEVRRYIVIP